MAKKQIAPTTTMTNTAIRTEMSPLCKPFHRAKCSIRVFFFCVKKVVASEMTRWLSFLGDVLC
jgi:hypothetical protein